MQAGLGVLGWPPSEFWSTTLREFNAALRGYNRSQGHPEVTVEELEDIDDAGDDFPDVVPSIVKNDG